MSDKDDVVTACDISAQDMLDVLAPPQSLMRAALDRAFPGLEYRLSILVRFPIGSTRCSAFLSGDDDPARVGEAIQMLLEMSPDEVEEASNDAMRIN